jgi:hypothetical protein
MGSAGPLGISVARSVNAMPLSPADAASRNGGPCLDPERIAQTPILTMSGRSGHEAAR